MLRRIFPGSSQALPFVPHSDGTEHTLDEKHTQIESKLQLLEVEFRRLTGQSFKLELQDDQLSRDARKCSKAIRFHLSLISKLILVPAEVWQRVFEYVVLANNRHDYQSLNSLCRVSPVWRAIAIGHSRLWSIFPGIIYWPGMPSKCYKNAFRCLKIYLSRSRNAPITFRFVYERWEAPFKLDTPALKLLLTLVEAAHRWESVWISGPGELMEDLSNLLVPGKLQLLSRISLELRIPTDSAREFRVDCFRSAPLLRRVDLVARGLPGFEAEGFFHITLPWSQLEKFQASTAQDTSYPEILKHSQQSLIKLWCETKQLPALNSIQEATFPRLKKLYLQSYRWDSEIQAADVLLHLGRLTLPSLTHLRVTDFPFATTDPLYESVISLIRRSGCSLKSLRLHSDVAPESTGQFVDLLHLCPELGFLDVRAHSQVMLQALRLNTTSPVPIVPQLKTLVLRAPSKFAWDAHGDRTFVDPLTFMDVVRSRTQDLRELDQSSISGGKAFHYCLLEEVRIIAYWNCRKVFRQQLIAFEDAALPPFDIRENSGVPRERVEDWRTHLQLGFSNPEAHHAVEYAKSAKVHWQMHRFMKKLEELELQPEEGLMFCRWGIPHHLFHLFRTRSGVISGDRVYNFRKRAGDLCRKWMTPALPAYEASPYRWCYINECSARLRFVTDSRRKKEASHPDLVWNDALGFFDCHAPPAMEYDFRDQDIARFEKGWY